MHGEIGETDTYTESSRNIHTNASTELKSFKRSTERCSGWMVGTLGCVRRQRQ
jgi:hypothetical protein